MSVKITIVGTGYVGLVSGACFAELGHDVICCDKDSKKIEILQRGGIPIFEPGLEEIVQRTIKSGRLRFSTNLGASVKSRDAVFIAVGTPSNGAGGEADLSYVMTAASEVATNLDEFTVIVTKSTVPVGTNRTVLDLVYRQLRPGVSVAIASNPEFLREGAAIGDFMRPDRIVVGAENEQAITTMRRIYAPLVDSGHPLILTGLETAEMIKYAANAFLAVKITFINEVSDPCEAVGADIERLAVGMGSDSRIGPAFLKVGPGWGGSCFPKDTRALAATAQQYGLSIRLVDAAIEANALRKNTIVRKIERSCGGSIAGKRLGVLGLTFKGQTDDMRESPGLKVVHSLVAKGAAVQAFDPYMPAAMPHSLRNVKVVQDPMNAGLGADALIVLTDWDVFHTYNLTKIASVMGDPVMIDLRNMFEEDVVRRSGFRRYVRMGKRDTNRVLGRELQSLSHA